MERLGKKRSFTKLIKLDQVFDRTIPVGNHHIGSNHVSVKVIDTNNNSFQLSYCPDPIIGSDAGSTRLKKGIPKNYSTPVSDGCFENFVSQTGVWVLVEISIEDPLIGGEQNLDISGDIGVTEGTSHKSSKVTVGTAITVIIPADSTRKIARLQWKSGGSIWVGRDDASELQHADYQNICQEIKPGEPIEWLNKGGLAAKTASGTAVYSMLEEIT